MNKTIADLPIKSCWDYERNSVNPNSVASGSGKKYWWLCPDCGISFPRTAYKMVTGTGRCKNCGALYRAKLHYITNLRSRPSVADVPEVAVLYANDLNERKAKYVLSMSDWRMKFYCKDCKAVFERQVKNVTLGQYYCNACAEKHRRSNYLKTRYEKHETCAECDNIIKIWDYERNATNNVFPDKLTSHSVREIHLLCPKCGNKWMDCPSARYNKLPMCPDCGSQRGGAANRQRALKTNGSVVDADKRILQYWHPTRNNTTPYEYTRNSKDECWFMCERGHEYKLVIADFVGRAHPCPICKPGSHTSFVEKVVAFYLSKVVDIKENYRAFAKKMELDIWIPSINTGVEYDGRYYHKGMEDRDRRKDEYCRENGIRLLRIKECDENCRCVDGLHYDYDSMDYQWLMDAVCDELNLPYVRTDISNDSLEIYDKVSYGRKRNSIAATRPDVDRLWDYKKNGNIKTSYVAQCTRQEFYWHCPDCGTSWFESAFAVCTRVYPCKVCGLRKRNRKV
jgi:very-short-patch-repair endonuclease